MVAEVTGPVLDALASPMPTSAVPAAARTNGHRRMSRHPAIETAQPAIETDGNGVAVRSCVVPVTVVAVCHSAAPPASRTVTVRLFPRHAAARPETVTAVVR